MNELKPFFSIVIPLYNKASHVKETIERVLDQTFQDFEIVVINDGSKDESVTIVETIKDDRIRIIHQENQGVSVARNRGIKESRAEYIAFLDADDLWLPEFLETIANLINDFPDTGLYATAYKKRKANGEEININIQALPEKEYIGLLPNYFESIVKGDFLVWTSALCIPKKVFEKNNIWFPAGEKYGEDQYVFARVAMKFDIAYNTDKCAIYQIEAENNTSGKILKEKEPLNSILMLKDYRSDIANIEKLSYFDKYIEKHIVMFISLNIRNNQKLYALKQMFKYNLPSLHIFKLLLIIVIPRSSYKFLKKLKNKFSK